MLRNHIERIQPSHVSEASCHDTTRQGERNREPAPLTRGAYLRLSLRAQQYIILRRSHSQVTKVPSHSPHITIEYSADIRYRTPRAGVCLHIQKPKPQATIKNVIKKKSINYLKFTIKCTNDDGAGQLRWQCYRRHQQNP